MATPSENVFAPPKAAVVDAPAGEEVEKASRGLRLLAKIIDGLLLTVGLGPAYFGAMPLLVQRAGTGIRPGTLDVWGAIAQTGGRFYLGLAVMLVVIAFDAFWVAQNGQTVGKKLCGIKIVRTNGSPAGFWRIFGLRYLISALIPMLLPVIGAVYFLVDSCVIFGGARRCIHDYIADTIVVRA